MFKQGFTLVELLVALTIMSIVAMLAYISYQGGMNSWNTARRRAEITTTARAALEYITNDLKSIYLPQYCMDSAIIAQRRDDTTLDPGKGIYFLQGGAYLPPEEGDGTNGDGFDQNFDGNPDDDGDGSIDEEFLDGFDNDEDGLVDEDWRLIDATKNFYHAFSWIKFYSTGYNDAGEPRIMRCAYAVHPDMLNSDRRYTLRRVWRRPPYTWFNPAEFYALTANNQADMEQILFGTPTLVPGIVGFRIVYYYLNWQTGQWDWTLSWDSTLEQYYNEKEDIDENGDESAIINLHSDGLPQYIDIILFVIDNDLQETPRMFTTSVYLPSGGD